MKVKKPLWATPAKEISYFKKAHGVFMLSGHLCQLMIVDLEDPIGVLLQKPKRLIREGQVITGVFCLNEYEVRASKKQTKPFHVVAVYLRKSKCFRYDADGVTLPMILSNPAIRFVIGEDRERCKKVLEMSND